MRNKLIGFSLGCSLALISLLWPALYNGQPLYFSDTTAYLRGVDAAMQRLAGHPSPWTVLEADDSPSGAPAQSPPENLNQHISVSSIKGKTVLAGRSVYYGMLLYLGDLFGHFWFTVIVQGMALMLAMGLFLRAFGLPQWPTLVAITIVVAALTPASFYVSFLMPDIFAAVTLLACVTLIAAHSLRRRDYLLWSVLLAFSVVTHSSHVLIALTLLGLALLVNLLYRSWTNRTGLLVIGACLLVAAGAEAAFGYAVKRIVGAPVLRPPFLMARAIEDGPGYQLFREACPQNGFKVCEFLNRLPMKADYFIWSFDPPGVFAPASPQMRRDLSAEQYRFVAEVWRRYPGAMARATIADVMQQMVKAGLYEFNWPQERRTEMELRLPPAYRQEFRNSAAYRDTMPARGFEIIQGVTVIVASLALLAILVRPSLRGVLAGEQKYMLTLVVLGIIANAVICGALSGPHDRYQARVVWLIPFAVLSAAFALWQHRQQKSPLRKP
jgi:hypothetical protein